MNLHKIANLITDDIICNQNLYTTSLIANTVQYTNYSMLNGNVKSCDYILSQLPRKGFRHLDVGAGIGLLEILAVEKGFSVDGVTYSDTYERLFNLIEAPNMYMMNSIFDPKGINMDIPYDDYHTAILHRFNTSEYRGKHFTIEEITIRFFDKLLDLATRVLVLDSHLCGGMWKVVYDNYDVQVQDQHFIVTKRSKI